MLLESYSLFMKHAQMVNPNDAFESLAVHVRKDGSTFDVEVRETMINYQGKPCLLNVMRDVSQRIQTEKILKGEMEARRREQATLIAISDISDRMCTLEFQAVAMSFTLYSSLLSFSLF